MPLAERLLAAYGGRTRWADARRVCVELSAWGWAFRLKWRRALRHARLELRVGRPEVRIRPIDAAGNVGVLLHDRVRIEREDGRVLAERVAPGRWFPGGRRALYWDRLDQTFFAGYAAWNYFTLPSLLLRADVEWTQVAEATLEARFPSGVPTHCPVQRFHCDPVSGLLRQHDYTAEVFGRWARAAHVVVEHGLAGGLRYTSRRRVYPRRGDGRPWPAPLLVGIDVHAFALE